ncbi:MAG: fumarylacetoacetate hydrolase family protein [Pseudomonadota bacterium]
MKTTQGAAWAVSAADGFRLGRGCPYQPDWQLSDTVIAAAEAALLPPVVPKTIIGAGRSYPAPGVEVPDIPPVFAKLPASIIGPGQNVRARPVFQSVMAEGELVLVMGKTLRDASRQDAENAIFGVSAGNDVTGLPIDMERLLQIKAADGFGPVGPCIATGLDINTLDISIAVNGERIASGNTRDHAYGFGGLLSYISQYFTLEPGDIVFTGSPAIAPEVVPSDTMTVEVTGVGRLENSLL